MQPAQSAPHQRNKSGYSTRAETLYFKEVSEHQILSYEDEVRLSQMVECGLTAARALATAVGHPSNERELAVIAEQGDQASRYLVESNLRLVVWMARRYLGLGLPLLDLVQEGNLGLQQAVWHFDWRRGVRFSTYAYWWIRQSLVCAVRKQGRAIRLPIELQSNVSATMRAEAALREEFGREATPAEVATYLGIPQEVVDEVHMAVTPVVSLDSPASRDGEYTWEEVIPDTTTTDLGAARVLQEELSQQVQALLGGLEEFEREIVSLRFGLNKQGPYSVRELAAKIGVSRGTIRGVLEHAIAKLRSQARSNTELFQAA